jgi:hypothetical protein
MILCSVLMTMLIPMVVLSQQATPRAAQQAAPRAAQQGQTRAGQLQLREREMDLQQRQANLKFQRQKQELELEARRVDLENARKANKKELHPLLILLAVVNILCAVWVYQDIQKMSRESGIWIVIVLLTGLLGTLVYAVIRIGYITKQKA